MPKGIYKHKEFTQEHRKKLSESHKGKKLSEETRRRMSIAFKKCGMGKWMKGRKFSEETRKKMSLATTGSKNHFFGKEHTPETIEKIRKAHIGKNLGEKSSVWKGDNVGYSGIHKWVVKNYGQPTTCEHCQTGNLIGHKIHWANISNEYKRDRCDWIRLCAKCHGLFDKQNGSRKRINKKNI